MTPMTSFVLHTWRNMVTSSFSCSSSSNCSSSLMKCNLVMNQRCQMNPAKASTGCLSKTRLQSFWGFIWSLSVTFYICSSCLQQWQMQWRTQFNSSDVVAALEDEDKDYINFHKTVLLVLAHPENSLSQPEEAQDKTESILTVYCSCIDSVDVGIPVMPCLIPFMLCRLHCV